MILGGEKKISEERIRSLCTRFRIRKLSLFGSALHGTMKEGSDVDLLVEFEPGHVPGLIALAGMQNEFSALIGSCGPAHSKRFESLVSRRRPTGSEGCVCIRMT
jgi:predicted nucleotidyltransferase